MNVADFYVLFCLGRKIASEVYVVEPVRQTCKCRGEKSKESVENLFHCRCGMNAISNLIAKHHVEKLSHMQYLIFLPDFKNQKELVLR